MEMEALIMDILKMMLLKEVDNYNMLTKTNTLDNLWMDKKMVEESISFLKVLFLMESGETMRKSEVWWCFSMEMNLKEILETIIVSKECINIRMEMFILDNGLTI